MEFRKHFTELNAKELEAINTAIHDTNNYKLSKHCKEKIEQRHIDITEIYKTIRIGKVIEYHYIDNSNRVLLRSKQHYQKRFICVVVDIKTHEVITVYPTSEDATLKPICIISKINILSYLH